MPRIHPIEKIRNTRLPAPEDAVNGGQVGIIIKERKKNYHG